jgi:hypothetical protein
MSSSVTSSFWARSIKGVELVKVMAAVLPVSPWREERLEQVSHVSLTDRGLFGGLLLTLAGVWLVVAGPLLHRLWLDIIGAILLVLGGYLFSIGVRNLHHTGH